MVTVPDVRPRRGFATIIALSTVRERRRLLDEASGQRVLAQRRERDGFRLVGGRQLLGPVRNWVATGAVCDEILHKMSERFAELVRPDLQPMQACYLFYDRGDFVDLHHDQARCQYDVLVILDGDAGPLCLHPELVRLPPRRLLAVARSGALAASQAAYLQPGPLVLAGRTTPHHRPPHDGDHSLTIAAFCFGTPEPG
jgi:hypothetical protein